MVFRQMERRECRGQVKVKKKKNDKKKSGNCILYRQVFGPFAYLSDPSVKGYVDCFREFSVMCDVKAQMFTHTRGMHYNSLSGTDNHWPG